MNVDPSKGWGFRLKSTNVIRVVHERNKNSITKILVLRFFSLVQSGAQTNRQSSHTFWKFGNKLARFYDAFSRPFSTCNLITCSTRRNAFISSRRNNLLSHINIPFAPLRVPPAFPHFSFCGSQLFHHYLSAYLTPNPPSTFVTLTFEPWDPAKCLLSYIIFYISLNNAIFSLLLIDGWVGMGRANSGRRGDLKGGYMNATGQFPC